VIVHTHDSWTEYGGLLELQDPWLSTPFIFALSRGPAADAALVEAYPERSILYFYPDQAERFYTSPRD
jgi:hypothetical protein